jgi:hypothetical protein
MGDVDAGVEDGDFHAFAGTLPSAELGPGGGDAVEGEGAVEVEMTAEDREGAANAGESFQVGGGEVGGFDDGGVEEAVEGMKDAPAASLEGAVEGGLTLVTLAGGEGGGGLPFEDKTALDGLGGEELDGEEEKPRNADHRDSVPILTSYRTGKEAGREETPLTVTTTG